MAKTGVCRPSILCSAALVAFAVVPAAAADPTPADASGSKVDVSSHPLMSTIRYAKSRSQYIRDHIRDYSCRLIKRERIEGKLQEHQFARVKVRCERRSGDEVVQPLSVYMQFLAPTRLKDRRVLYIADQNDGQVLVRKGGSILKYLKLRVDSPR